jgi:hypothetical protein
MAGYYAEPVAASRRAGEHRLAAPTLIGGVLRMTNFVKRTIAVVCIGVASVACAGDSPTGTGGNADEPMITWYIASSAYSAADVYLNSGYVGTIRGRYTGSVSCGMESGVGRLTMSLEAGQSYGWKATAYCATCVQGQQQVFAVVGQGWTAQKGKCYLASIN